MPINMPAVPKPEKVQLGEGVLIYNFNPDNLDDPNSIPFGATRGGGTYSVEPTNKPIRFDGDRGEHTKGAVRRSEWVISIVANALELDLDKVQKVMPGNVEDSNSESGMRYKKYRPKAEFEEEDYIDNLAYVTKTHAGKTVAYVIENALGDGALAAAFEDKEELVAETTFHAHFDPNNMDEIPTYIIHYNGQNGNGSSGTEQIENESSNSNNEIPLEEEE